MPSSLSEPSIITELKPDWMERKQMPGEAPWSWCMQTGICGYIFDGGQDQVAQEGFAGVVAGAGGALQDHRGVGLRRRPP